MDSERVRTAVLPLGLCDREVGLCATFGEVWRNVHLDSRLLRELGGSIRIVGLRVTSGNENTTVGEELCMVVYNL